MTMLFLRHFGVVRGGGSAVLIVALVAGASLARLPARAGAQAQQPVTAATTPPKKPKIVCKDIDPPTGSHVGGTTVCRPEADWSADERQTQREADAEIDRERALQAYDQNKNPFSGPAPK
jgi:hypothetical protein